MARLLLLLAGILRATERNNHLLETRLGIAMANLQSMKDLLASIDNNISRLAAKVEELKSQSGVLTPAEAQQIEQEMARMNARLNGIQ